ncbi:MULTISPECIES: helix-turn-helix domain-containing protein [Shewanella]|uniref:Helix-turn-helix domain-containing protein n=1 Tax=Shewanella marisflavi TaxID=260364 RepID=A0ABX5WP05_9GAMM|nr:MULTISPECIES: helix-turn-helix domain-containing protein [Shewanella]QDF75994.1 helix-turn-helix domain-containing protein [Shewanella marisflavi]
MTSRCNPNRIKIHRCYTVIEVSELLGVHPRTVRNWIRAGLPVFDETRPLLIQGADLKIFLKRKRKAYMHQCAANEVYCFMCKQSNKPNIESVSFIGKPAGMAQMAGRCSVCGSKANKYVSWRNINAIWSDLGGKLPIAEKHLNLRGKALLNCPLKGGFDHEKE